MPKLFFDNLWLQWQPIVRLVRLPSHFLLEQPAATAQKEQPAPHITGLWPAPQDDEAQPLLPRLRRLLPATPDEEPDDSSSKGHHHSVSNRRRRRKSEFEIDYLPKKISRRTSKEPRTREQGCENARDVFARAELELKATKGKLNPRKRTVVQYPSPKRREYMKKHPRATIKNTSASFPIGMHANRV